MHGVYRVVLWGFLGKWRRESLCGWVSGEHFNCSAFVGLEGPFC